jgi:hypothetical protein
MSEMTDEHDGAPPPPARALRCPDCGAARTASAGWCLQCYRSFADEGRRVPPPPAGDPGDEPPVGPATAEPVDGLGPVAHRPVVGAPLDDDAQALADRMLADLSAHEAGTSGRLGTAGGRLQGRGAKLGVVLGGTLGLTVVLFGLMALLGALL